MDKLGGILRRRSTLPIQHGELAILGAANEILQQHTRRPQDAVAVFIRRQQLTVRVDSPVVREHLRSKELKWLTAINTLLSTRYGAPAISRVYYRVLTEQ